MTIISFCLVYRVKFRVIGKKMPITCDQIGHWSNRVTFKNIMKCIYENLINIESPFGSVYAKAVLDSSS